MSALTMKQGEIVYLIEEAKPDFSKSPELWMLNQGNWWERVSAAKYQGSLPTAYSHWSADSPFLPTFYRTPRTSMEFGHFPIAGPTVGDRIERARELSRSLEMQLVHSEQSLHRLHGEFSNFRDAQWAKIAELEKQRDEAEARISAMSARLRRKDGTLIDLPATIRRADQAESLTAALIEIRDGLRTDGRVWIKIGTNPTTTQAIREEGPGLKEFIDQAISKSRGNDEAAISAPPAAPNPA